MKTAQIIVRIASLYNLGGAFMFLTPGVLPLFGITPPALLWLVLPAIFALFAAVVLWLSSRDLMTYGSFPYWNGWFRLAFVIAVFALGLYEVGAFIAWLAAGDLLLALATIWSVKHATAKTHKQLLLNGGTL